MSPAELILSWTWKREFTKRSFRGMLLSYKRMVVEGRKTMASLRKFEIINALKVKYGITIKSVQQLNKILEEMGILHHYGNGWATTQNGLPFSIYSSQVFNADLWRENIVEAIAKYVKSK